MLMAAKAMTMKYGIFLIYGTCVVTIDR